MICPTCGTKVKIVGNGTTMHYEPIEKITLNRERLARVISNHRGGHGGFPPAKWDYEEADSIIQALSTLIEACKQ